MAALEAENFWPPQDGWRRARRGCRVGGAPGRATAGAVREGKQMAMDWDKLRVFHAVAEAGSFTHAGEALNLSQSAVSRQISALEESLSVPLFHRHARGLILTEQGELLFRTAREVFAKLAMSESADLTESRRTGRKGRSRSRRRSRFGSIWLTPRIREFLDLYPEIQVSLVVDDAELDLSMREADVAIRMSPPRQPDLIQRHLVTVQVHIYGSPDYLKKYGTPQRPEELDKHRLIVYGEDSRPPVPGINWLLDSGAKPGRDRRPILSVNNIYGMLRAVRAGLALPRCPDFMAHEHSDLVRVLPGTRRAAERRALRLSGGAALIEAHQRLPRLPVAQGRRRPAQLNPHQLKHRCGELSRIYCGSTTALRFLQTWQNQFPLVIKRVNRDIRLRAILHRDEFPRRSCLERVSGTCARKEGLRTLTSPRREASLFKLGRAFGFGQFLLHREGPGTPKT